MDYNRPTSNSFEKSFTMFILLLFTVCLGHLPFHVKLEQFKRQQIAAMNDRVPKERLGTCRLNNIFHKLFLYDTTPKKKYLQLETGSG